MSDEKKQPVHYLVVPAGGTGLVLRGLRKEPAAIGKWHLGWDWTHKEGKAKTVDNIGFAKRVANGPTDRGFDYFYGLTSPSGPPYLYMVNDMAEKQPNTRFEESGGGLYKIKGGIGHSDWSADGMQPHLADKMLGYRMADDEAEDSFSFWPILDGSGNSARTDLIATSGAGYFTYRTPQYKLIFNAGNGSGEEYRIDGQPPLQFYDMVNDPEEKVNQINNPEYAGRIREMAARVKKYIEDGRSTPGAKAANDGGNS
ncbi:hypothetical protein [Alistipes shahii]|uniref:hypothetical protein n=1 Tax=Alistipes shahii TaxID=328814 RepID=UPI00266C45EC|nr:hypothetical protein [Alistipes shahii]